MTKKEIYRIWSAALMIIQNTHPELDIDNGPGDCLRDHMDRLWYDMKEEEKKEFYAGD